MASAHPRLSLQIAPRWEAIKETWDRCIEFLGHQGLDSDEAYALSMAAQELLENGVKYGAFADSQRNVVLEVDCGDGSVTIEVRSPAGDDAAGLRRLDSAVQWIRGFQSPFEAYVEKLKEVSAQPYREGESGLGLVRIAYEAQAVIDFYVDDSNTLALSAFYRREP